MRIEKYSITDFNNTDINKLAILKLKKRYKKTKITLIIVVFFLSISIAFSMYCIFEIKYLNKINTEKHSIIQEQREQITARNKVIDRELGTNLVDPLSQATDKEQLEKLRNKQKNKKYKIINDEMIENFQVPLYTPDGKYFGIISYPAYEAILYNNLNQYICRNEGEKNILHSYINYIEINKGMSISIKEYSSY